MYTHKDSDDDDDHNGSSRGSSHMFDHSSDDLDTSPPKSPQPLEYEVQTVFVCLMRIQSDVRTKICMSDFIF